MLTLCEPCLIDRIERLYLDRPGITYREIAEELGVSEFEVYREIDRHVGDDGDIAA